MPRRTTRDHIRYHVDRSLLNLNRALVDLQKADGKAGGRSLYIEDTLPQLVAGFEALRRALEAFKEGL